MAIIIIRWFTEITMSYLVNNVGPRMAPKIHRNSRKMTPSLTGDKAGKFIYYP